MTNHVLILWIALICLPECLAQSKAEAKIEGIKGSIECCLERDLSKKILDLNSSDRELSINCPEPFVPKQGGVLKGDNVVHLKKTASIHLEYERETWFSESHLQEGESQFAIINDSDKLAFYIPIDQSRLISGLEIEDQGGIQNTIRTIIGSLKIVVRSSSLTRVVFNVSGDSTGQIYLDKGKPGAVTLPKASIPLSLKKTLKNGKMRKGDVIFFKGDKMTKHTHIKLLEATAAATTTAVLAQNLRNFVKKFKKLHKPWWQKPKYYVPAAVLLITIPTILITTNGGKDLPGPPGVPVIHR